MSLSGARLLGLHPAFSAGQLINLCALVSSSTKLMLRVVVRME